MKRVSVREAEKVRIVDVSGKFIIGGPELELREAVKRILEDGHTRIVVNLKDVTMIDSAGIGELIACKFRVQKQEGAIHLVKPSKDIAFKPMIIADLTWAFNIFDDELTAVGSF
jgi:anti-sigma B factor antagonist